MRRTVQDLARLTGAAVAGDLAAEVRGVAIDSRDVRPGDLFVAIPGARVDGHDFIDEAARRGATAVLISRDAPTALPALFVPDTLEALRCIAAAERISCKYRLVGITGSLGKTTTKDFLADLMGTAFRVGKSHGNRNSETGLPVEICNQAPDIEWMVAEMGMNHPGELDRLGTMARPDALLYTVIAPVHLEFFDSIEGIAEAKAELIPHLKPEGTLVLNGADRLVASLADRFVGRAVFYGSHPESALWIEDWLGRGLLGASFALRGPEVRVPVQWQLAGRHQAENLLAACACALALGVSPAAVPAVAAGLAPTPRRGEIHRLADGIVLVDDSYNASPVAMEALLDLLAETPGRRVAVLGEMRELGETSAELHRRVGACAAGRADVLVTVGGELAAAMADAAAPLAPRRAADAGEAIQLVRGLLRGGDVVLVKASRGVGLDRLVDALVEGKD